MVFVNSEAGRESLFLKYVKSRIAHNQNFMVVITGPTGSGKTYSALRIAQTLDPGFSIERVVFGSKDFMHVINHGDTTGELYSGAVIVYDEAGVGLSSKEWQSLQNRLINYVMQTFRHRNLIVIFTTPHLGFMDKSSRTLMHSYAETVGIDRKEKTVTLKPLLLQVNQRSGEVYYKYLRALVQGRGMVPVKRLIVGLPSDELLLLYEKRKLAYTKELNRSILEELEAVGQKKERPLSDRLTRYLGEIQRGGGPFEIAERMDTSAADVWRAVSELRGRGYIIEPCKTGNFVYKFDVKTPKVAGECEERIPPVIPGTRSTELADAPKAQRFKVPQ